MRMNSETEEYIKEFKRQAKQLWNDNEPFAELLGICDETTYTELEKAADDAHFFGCVIFKLGMPGKIYLKLDDASRRIVLSIHPIDSSRYGQKIRFIHIIDLSKVEWYRKIRDVNQK